VGAALDDLPEGRRVDVHRHYEYTPDTEKLSGSKEDVVHFRFGLDSDDPKLGSSPLKSVLREVFTDDEAAAFTASLLRNMGVPGLVFRRSGRDDQPGRREGDEADVQAKFSATARRADRDDRRDEVHQFGFSPEQLLLKELRRIPEERVTAVFGIPAIVAGLGAGLDRSTFTNMGEAREAAYEAGSDPDAADHGGGRSGSSFCRVRGRPVRVAVRVRPVEGAGAAGGSVPAGAAARPGDPRRLGDAVGGAARDGVGCGGGPRQRVLPSVEQRDRPCVWAAPARVTNGTGAAAGLTASDVADSLDAVLTRRELTHA
jgi:hypothetical protein